MAALYHDLLGRDSLEDLLSRAADAVVDLVPCSSLLVAETDSDARVIVPLLARGSWQEETLKLRPRFGEGLIGWVVENARPLVVSEAHLDPRAGHLPGTPASDPETIMCFPLLSAGAVIGAFSLYREGPSQRFTDEENEIAQHFADAVALALANAKAREDLVRMARTDYLTDCLNRRGFDEALRALAATTRELRRSTALVLIDLDEFKLVNDAHGHHTGDVVLRHVAELIRQQAPEGAIVARLGGDEFAVAFVTDDEAEVGKRARDIAEAVRDIPFVTAGAVISVTGSVGTSIARPDAAHPAEELLRAADAAMYERKREQTDRRNVL